MVHMKRLLLPSILALIFGMKDVAIPAFRVRVSSKSALALGLIASIIAYAFCAVSVTILFALSEATAQTQTEWRPSTELCSGDQEYCVKIVAETQDPNKRELIVSSKAGVLAKFPTFGYLMDAFWSPDNKYVAINNRRANAGDYLWVISLKDGAALKVPDDVASDLGKRNLGHIIDDDPWGKTVREVTTRFSDCAKARLDHRFLYSQGWKSASDLLVMEELQFSKQPPQTATITAPSPGPDGKTRSITATLGFYGPNAPGIWIGVNKRCQVTRNQIALKKQTIERHEHSSEFVNRAWTFAPYSAPNPAEEIVRSAQAKEAKGDFDGAIADYGRLIELGPQNPGGYYGRAVAKSNKGDWDGAIADYNRTLELDPKNAYAYNNRGLMKQAKNDADGAMADYSHAIELDPKNSYAYSNRCLAKDGKGDYDGAIADCDRAIELDPKNPKSYRNRGFAKAWKGDLEGGIADYNRVIEIEPNYSTVYGDRGLARYLLRNWTDALGDYQRFYELSLLSPNAQDYGRLSIWLIRNRLGEAETASKELSAYLDKRPKATASDWFSKLAEHLLGKLSETELFAAAKSSDAQTDRGQHCEAWFYAGMKKLFSGDKKTAADYFHKCLATEQKDFIEFQLAQSELKETGF